MFDRRARQLCSPVLDAIGARLARFDVKANRLTSVGWAVGVGACVTVALRLWALALVAWLVNRLIDGVDGALARRQGATDFGGYLDLLADFSVYSGFIVALAVAEPDTRLASVGLLFTYYVSATALLGASALLDRHNVERGDDRSIRFLGGIAEGLETMVAYVLILLAPSHATWIEWIFAAMVLVTALQRLAWARQALRDNTRATSSNSSARSQTR